MDLLLGFILPTAVFTTGAHASAMDQEPFAKCLWQVESQLGKPATSKAVVYELSAVHAMELEFNQDCQIVKVEIGPKYFWEQKIPEWGRPGTSNRRPAMKKANPLVKA